MMVVVNGWYAWGGGVGQGIGEMGGGDEVKRLLERWPNVS